MLKAMAWLGAELLRQIYKIFEFVMNIEEEKYRLTERSGGVE